MDHTISRPEDLVQVPNPRLLPSWAGHASVRLPPPPEACGLFDTIALPEGLLRAVPGRQLQFQAGRYCAREALRALGETGVDVPRAASGAPVWPAGITGSITHTDEFASAAVARVSDARALGIDTERVVSAERAAGISRVVATPEELANVRAAGYGWCEALTLVFSAKEATFKCLHPLVGRLFGFHTVRIVEVDRRARAFEAVLVTSLGQAYPSGTRLKGRFEIDDPWVHTAVVVPPDRHARRPAQETVCGAIIGS